jgi:hypothetical protein
MNEGEGIGVGLLLLGIFLVGFIYNVCNHPLNSRKSFYEVAFTLFKLTGPAVMDTFSDAVYLLSSPFVNDGLFYGAWVFFFSPLFWFLFEMRRKRLTCAWHFGAPPSWVFFEKYDSVFNLIATCLMLIPFILLNSPWLFPWLLIGWFAYSTKLMAVKPVHDLWVNIWSGNKNEFVLETYVDIPQLNTR